MAGSDKTQQAIIVALATVFLALAYIVGGFAVVEGVPQITENVAASTIDDSNSPFSKEQLVQGAMATRDYSFTSNDLARYQEQIAAMNEVAETPYAGVSVEDLMAAPDQYTVNEEAISHLDDVHGVFSRLMIPMFSIAVIAVVLMMYALRYMGMGVVGKMFLYSGIAVLALMGVFGTWALVSFDSFFAVFHSLFFADGTWVFPADSLLITMLPEGFWATMGAIWFGISAFLAILSIVFGLIIKKRSKQE